MSIKWENNKYRKLIHNQEPFPIDEFFSCNCKSNDLTEGEQIIFQIESINPSDFSNNVRLVVTDFKTHRNDKEYIPFTEGGTLFYIGDKNIAKHIAEITANHFYKNYEILSDNPSEENMKKIFNYIESIKDNIEKQHKELQISKKAGYIDGVCECVAALGDDYTLGKKLLTEMNVSKDMAQKFANPETYKKLEQGIFAQEQEQNLEQTQGIKR